MLAKLMKYVGLGCLLVVIFAGMYIANNYTYLKRVYTSKSAEQIRNIDWYEPKATLRPADDVPPLATAPVTNLAVRFPDTFAYAEKTHSSALLVWHQGQLISEHYWAPYTQNSYTQTQSVHKSVLSMLVGIAIDEGGITSVDDPVEKYLGKWIDQPYGTITLSHLLTMSSGLGKPPAPFFLNSHFLRLLNDPDISAVARSLPQKIAPGTEFEYINNNPQLLVDVLEAATGKPYEQYMQEKLWSQVAHKPGYLWLDNPDGVPHGYCCLMALPRDLLRLGLLVLNKGKVANKQVVPAEWITKSTTPSKLNPNYGYLTWLGSPPSTQRIYAKGSPFSAYHSAPFVVDDVIFFDGFGGQRVYIVPSQSLVIVRVGQVTMDFDDALIPNSVINQLSANN